MNLEHVRRQMIVRSALMLFVLISFATLVRPFMVSQPMTFTYLGVLDALLTGTLYLYLSQNRVQSWHAYLVIAFSFVAIVPVMYLSGGVHSHFAVVLPLAPVMVCLIAPARAAWWVAGLCIVILCCFFVFTPGSSDQVGSWQMAGNAKVRLLWLSLGCVMGAAFGAEFDRVSTHLSNASQSSLQIDTTTGALDRTAILEALTIKREKTAAQENWISVVLVQISSINRIQALFGEQGAEKALQGTACALRDCIRLGEDVVGRYEDSTFLLVLEHVDQCHAHRIAENIDRSLVDHPVYFDNERIDMQVAIGYCSLPGQEAHSDEILLESASRALFTAKHNGSNNVVGSEESIVQSLT